MLLHPIAVTVNFFSTTALFIIASLCGMKELSAVSHANSSNILVVIK